MGRGRGRGSADLHVVRDAAVADEVGDARAEGADREVEVAHDVERQAVVGADQHLLRLRVRVRARVRVRVRVRARARVGVCG